MAAANCERPVLRYHGGKWLLAPWIISLMPRHRIYVEPFGGAASILMQKPRSYAEVYNDRWDTVVNVFRVLRDPKTAHRLQELLELTPFSRSEFEECGEQDISSIADEVERARRTILRSFCGFGSASTNARYATGFRANSNKSGTTPAGDWKNYPENISSFVHRLRGVCIENRHATEVIEQHDTPESLFYVDPPYMNDTRNMQRANAAYVFEMSDTDHQDLAAHLHRVRGMVMLSGYRNELYEQLYGKWQRFDRQAMADGARPRIESIWMNPLAAMSNMTLFSEASDA